MNGPTTPTILYAEDDRDDRLLAEMAHRDSGVINPLVFVGGGREALEYLRRTGRHADRVGAAQPAIVLLDLHMPGMGGLEILRTIKTDALLRRIPVMILTSSTSAEDIAACYDAGANSYSVKPTAAAGFAAFFEILCRYWLGTVSLGLGVEP
jgi:CheY-like chemotaxis protein